MSTEFDHQDDAPADRLARLEAQVAELAAKDAARSLMHDYALACDNNDVEGVTALFLPHADVWAGELHVEGGHAIEAFYRAGFGVQRCHLIGVADLQSTGPDAVSASATFVAIEVDSEGARLLWGTYRDRIVVTGGTARFASKRITIQGSASL